MWSANAWAFVPIEPKPLHSIEDARHHFGGRAFSVRIFDAQNKRAAVATCVEPVEKRRARAADV
jgi:hypothetical protein